MKLNQKICMLFLFIFLVFRPLYKYFEYILSFPRINMSVILGLLFVILVLYNIYLMGDPKIKGKAVYSFLLLLMVSLIQIISFPWAITYSSNGEIIFLTTIIRTIAFYFLFWYTGLYIKEILDNKIFWNILSKCWWLIVVTIFLNALSNNIFAIILEGETIYLMLADSFAILSIFILCRENNLFKQYVIVILSCICLYALWSRASLYCFIIPAIIFLFNKNKPALILTISISFLFIYLNSNFQLENDRMTRVLFGGYDYSQAEREKQLSKGIEDIYDVWLLGSFMGDIEKNFGKQGKYIHNYLSFWRQFGIVPFTIFFLILLSNFLIIIKNWIFFKKTKKPHIFLICFTIFSLLQIIFARAFVFPYIWLSIGGISSYLNDIESNT